MLQTFEDHLSKYFPFLNDRKLLLAVSGGLDSMVMVDLFRKLKYKIAIAHCNFQLRGVESFDDQNFVRDYAEANDLPFFITQFDTQAFAEDYKLSIQVAARELRYNWFYELLEANGYDYILTAHHADDNLETFLINLSRGTGLNGLIGIPSHSEQLVRPLLEFTRDEIAEYADLNTIQWREDSSNASDKYLRNKLRHDVIPVIKELNSNFLATFKKTQMYLREAKEMVDDAAVMVYQQVAEKKGDEIHFDLKQLRRLPNYESYLYEWLNEFGFRAWDDIYELVDAQSGKKILAAEFQLIKNRQFLILSPINESVADEEYYIGEDQTEVLTPLKISLKKTQDITKATNTIIFVDQDKLKFPLLLRRWRQGDSFYPLGMDGKSKKVSKLFKDEKMSVIEKENAWLLYSQDKIVWVIGIRQDERFKINSTTKNILQIALL